MELTRTGAAAVLALAMAAACLPAHAEDSDADRNARWHDIAAMVFKGRPVTDGGAILQLDAPPRALDAALVPVTITAQPNARLKTLYFIVDDNPAPVAAIVHFGPLADPRLLKLRVRVDQYTLLHAVGELQNGSLVSVAQFIKAAGGCSAPNTANQAEAAARLGRMKLFLHAPATATEPETADLLISHPNYNGMQMDPVSRLYTPARYVQTVTVSQGGGQILTMDGDISLSQDPAISFAYHATGTAPLDVTVQDSAKTVFHHSFPATDRPG
jgi:sulfur-oxidizing protein SoxY